MEPEDSLIMRDENLSTIPKKEPDEVIKSSVEDLFPIPSESEDTSENEWVESLHEEDVQEENFKMYSNPLFEFDEEYISSDINPLYNEVLKDINRKNSLLAIDEPFLLDTPPPGSKLVSLEEVRILTPPFPEFSGMMMRGWRNSIFRANEDECFDAGGGKTMRYTFGIEDDYYNSKETKSS
ncbi:hypothetical protein Tco_0569271 [Tanacetum coccineum]